MRVKLSAFAALEQTHSVLLAGSWPLHSWRQIADGCRKHELQQALTRLSKRWPAQLVDRLVAPMDVPAFSAHSGNLSTVTPYMIRSRAASRCNF